MKSVYLLYEILTAFVRLPYWALLAIPRSLTQLPRIVMYDTDLGTQRIATPQILELETYIPGQAHSPSHSHIPNVTLICTQCNVAANILHSVGPLYVPPSYLALVPGIGYHGVWVQPVASEHIIGKLKVWATASAVSPVKLPGYWLHKSGSTIEPEAPLMPGEKIVYALHGGAYTRLSAHPSDPTAGIARGLLDRVDSVHRTFTIEYRLSSTKPYPIGTGFIVGRPSMKD